jgi:hypothetical protein
MQSQLTITEFQMTSKKQRICFNLDADVNEKLKQLAKHDNRPVNMFLEELVKKLCKNVKS